MTLQEYLDTKGIKASKFAEAMKRPPSTITRLLDGKRKAGRDLAAAIETVTGGDVTWQDLRPDLYPPNGRAA